MTTVEEIIKELFDNFKYPAIQSVWNNFKQFEQKEIIDYLDVIITEAYNLGYKESEDESYASYDDGYESGKEDSEMHIEKVLQENILFNDDVFEQNETPEELYYFIVGKLRNAS